MARPLAARGRRPWHWPAARTRAERHGRARHGQPQAAARQAADRTRKLAAAGEPRAAGRCDAREDWRRGPRPPDARRRQREPAVVDRTARRAHADLRSVDERRLGIGCGPVAGAADRRQAVDAGVGRGDRPDRRGHRRCAARRRRRDPRSGARTAARSWHRGGCVACPV